MVQGSLRLARITNLLDGLLGVVELVTARCQEVPKDEDKLNFVKSDSFGNLR